MIERISLGEMGMSEADFLRSTPRLWRSRLEGLRGMQRDALRSQWEIARWQAATIMAPHLKRPISPQKLLRFPWEQAEHDNIVATIEKHRDIFAKLTPPTP